MVTRRRGLTRLATVCALTALWTTGVGALTDADKCESTKLKTAAKYGFCRLKAEAKAVKTGGAPDFSKCDEKYGLKWALAESTAGPGVCPSENDEASLQAFITQHADDVATALAGGSLPSCPSDLTMCTSDLLQCTSDLTQATADLGVCQGNLAVCSGDLASCESDLTTCQTQLLCGNGTVDPGEDCDFGDMNGQTCVSLGFNTGTLNCAPGCVYDTSGCSLGRFVDNGDGTISDISTGLMWEKKVALDATENPLGPHDADNRYAWVGQCSVLTSKLCQPNLSASNACTAGAAGGSGCAECVGGEGTCSIAVFTITTVWNWLAQLNASAFAGYADWRIPTTSELLTLADFGDATAPRIDVAFDGSNCGGACTNLADPSCSCTALGPFPGDYSSATTVPTSTVRAYALNVSMLQMNEVPKSTAFAVRAVRGGS